MPPRHDITTLDEPTPARVQPLDRQRQRMLTSATRRKDLVSPQYVTPRACPWTYLPYFVIIDFLSPHVFKQAFAYFPLPLLGFLFSSSRFGILLVKPFFFVNLIFYEHVRLLLTSSGPFPLSAHYRLYKRGRDPPTNPSRHLKNQRSELPLKWRLEEDRGRRPTAASASQSRAVVGPVAKTAASPCPDHGILSLPPPPLSCCHCRPCAATTAALEPPPLPPCAATATLSLSLSTPVHGFPFHQRIPSPSPSPPPSSRDTLSNSISPSSKFLPIHPFSIHTSRMRSRSSFSPTTIHFLRAFPYTPRFPHFPINFLSLQPHPLPSHNPHILSPRSLPAIRSKTIYPSPTFVIPNPSPRSFPKFQLSGHSQSNCPNVTNSSSCHKRPLSVLVVNMNWPIPLLNLPLDLDLTCYLYMNLHDY